MMASLERGFGQILAVLLISGAIGLGAAPAQAGVSYQVDVCADASQILAFFADASDFTGLANCESLCQKSYGKCKAYISRSKACELASVSDGKFFNKEMFCDPIADPAIRKACREEIAAEAAFDRDLVKEENAAAKDFCAEIRDACILDCTIE